MSTSKITRRQLLTGAAAVAGAAGIARVARGRGNTANAMSAQSRVSVGVAHARKHRDAIEAALKQASALAAIKRGDKVLLKVNTNSGDPFPYSTSPEMVRYLGARLRDHGAKVFVGDRSFWGDPNTLANLEANGIAAAARSVAAKVVAFENKKVGWKRIPKALVPHWRGPVRVPSLVVECDHVINLPCVKTHFITTYTMALKNVLGLVHPADRARPGNLRTHEQEHIYKQIADINRFVRSDLHVLDGYSALITGGPTPRSGAKPKVVQPRMVLASTDPIAIDAVGIALLLTRSPKTERVTQFTVWKNPMIRAAVAAGVGIASPDRMQLRGAGGFDYQRLGKLAKVVGLFCFKLKLGIDS